LGQIVPRELAEADDTAHASVAMLEHADFTIGWEFWTETGCWRCTDVGTLTVCAIKLDGDPRNWNGPPYSVAEHVFDENDFGALYASRDSILG
jgi:hypothetical protein